MNILITGCNGQLGNEMQLLEKVNPQHQYFNTDVAQLDITNPEAIEEFVNNNAIDIIVNCAAFTAVDKAESSQELCHLLNAKAPEYLAAAVAKRGGYLVQVSMSSMAPTTLHIPKTRLHALTAFMVLQNSKARNLLWQHVPTP